MNSLGIVLIACAVGAGLVGSGMATAGAMGSGPMAGWMSQMGHGGMKGGSGCHMCTGSSAGTTGTGTLVVIRSYQFQPTSLNVRAGDTVTWRNDDNVAHTVTSDSGSELDSPLLQPGQSWTHTFSNAGTYDYHCTPHSSQGANGSYSGMTGRVVVS